MNERNEKQPKRFKLHHPKQFAFHIERGGVDIVSCCVKKDARKPCTAQLLMNPQTVESVTAQALNDGWTFHVWMKHSMLVAYCPAHAKRKSNPPAIITFLDQRIPDTAPLPRQVQNTASKSILRLRKLLRKRV